MRLCVYAILLKVAKLEILQSKICLNCWGTDLENRPGEIQLSENLHVFETLPRMNSVDHSTANPEQLHQWINPIGNDISMTSAFPHQTLLDFFQGFNSNSFPTLLEQNMSGFKLFLFCKKGRVGKRLKVVGFF